MVNQKKLKGGNENPLWPFTGCSLEVRVNSVSAGDICEFLYEAIGPKNGNNFRVASAVMVLNLGGFDVHIINRSERGN